MSIFGAVGSFFKNVGTAILNAWNAADTFQRINMVLQAATFAVGVKGFLQARDMLAKGQDIMANKVAAGGKIPVIYGTRRVGAQIVYMDTAQNRSKDLFVVYALCVGEVEQILGNTIELDGNAITDKVRFRDGWYLGSDKINSGAGSLCTADQVGSGTSASTQRAGQSGTDPTKKYRAVFNLHHGAASQTADPMLRASIGSQWTTAHRLDGIAYIAASFEYDTKGMWKGVPQLTVQVKGRKVFDPRTNTTAYSDNAALCFLDFIRNNEYGKGIPDAKINMTTFSAAANLADTQLNVPYYNGNFQNVTFNGRSGDNFITITDNEDWWQNKVDQRITLKDSNGTTIIDDKSIDAVTRYKYFGETTQDSRVYFDGVVPPRDTTADGGVTLSATNGDATITVTDNSHGAAANDEVLLTGAVSLGGNITAAVINQVYTIATVINANSYTIEAEDLSGTTVLANSSDTGNGGNAVGAKYQYKNDDGTIRGKSKRFTCNGYIDTNKNVMDNAKELLANMRGIFTYFDGKYELKIEDTGSATFNITDAHIIEDNGISVDYGNKDAKANKVIVEFFNANKRYELDTATVFHNASPQYFSDDGDEILEIKAEFPYVTSPYIAYNMAKTILTRSRNQTKVSFLGTAEMYKLNIGDIVDLTYAGLGFSSKVFIVEALELQPNGLVGVSLLEYFDVYTWEVPPQEPTEPLQNTPSAYAVSPPDNVAFTDTNASPTGRPRITWDAPTDYPDYEFRVAISDSGGNALQNSLVETNFVDLNFIPVGSNYVASVTSINSTGSESNATTLTFSVANEPIKGTDIQTDTKIIAGSGNNVGILDGSHSTFRIYAGNADPDLASFKVTQQGLLTATGVTVTGNINADTLNVQGATVTGTIDASKITLNGDPLTDIFALAGSGQAKTLSLGGDTKNLLKVDGIQLKYFAFDQVQNQGTEVLQMDLDDLELFNTRLDHKKTTIKSEGSIVLSSISSPSTTSNKLYNVGGSLHFNGTALGTGTGDITAVVAGTNLNGGGTTGSVTLNLDSTITGNHTFSNNLIVGGDLTVQGTTTTIDTTNLDVKDKNITLNFSTGDSSANANGAGITIQDAVSQGNDATILWDNTNDEFDFSHKINVTGTVDMDGFTSVGNGTITGDLLIQEGSGFPRITLKDTDGTNTQSFINHSGSDLTLTTQNGTANGRLIFARYNGTTTTTSGYFDANGKFFLNGNVDISGTIASGAITSTGTSTFGTVTSASYKVGASTVIDNSRNLINIGTISSGAITTSQGNIIVGVSGTPQIKLNDTGNAGGGAASGKVIFSNTAGNAMAIGYTGDSVADSDMIISTNAGGTYGGYLGLDSGAISDAQADIILEPKTNVRIATGSLKIGTTTVIDSSRNLLNIGTISSGAITSSGTVTADTHFTSSDSNATLSTSGTGGTVRLRPNGSSSTSGQLTVQSTGNVGIGNDSPSASLDVFSSDAGIATFTRDLTTDVSLNVSADNSGVILSTGGVHAFRVFTNSAERMRIDSQGRLGLGTTSPDSLLHLHNTSQNSYIHLSGGGSLGETYGGFVRGYGVSGEGGHLELGVIDNGTKKVGIEITEQGNEIIFDTAATERMRIDSSGRVGIGRTPSSGFKLDLDTSSGSYQRITGSDQANVRLRFTNGGSGGKSYEIVGGLAGANNSAFSIFDVDNSATRFSIASDGKTTFNSVITIPATVPSSKGGKALRFPVDADTSGTTELEFFTPLSSPASTLTVNNTLTAGAIDIPSNGTNDTRIEIGTSPLANHNAYVDLVGDTTYTDYGLRLIRYNSGANTNSQLVHRGTGSLFIEAQDAGNVILKSNGSEVLRANSSSRVGINTTSLTADGLVIGTNNSNCEFDMVHTSGKRFRINNLATGVLQFENKTDGTTVMSVDASGNFNAINGIRINGTEVISGGRNLSNIGTINSGAITSSGDITLAANLKATGNNLKFFAGGNHIINMDLNGNFYPQTHNAVDLGFSDSLAFRNLHLVGAITGGATISSGAITSSGASSGRYTGLEVVNSTNAGGTETAIGLGVVSASNTACDVKLVANRVGANAGSDFYIEQTDAGGNQQETFRITESGNATFAGEIFLGNQKEINFAKSDGTNDGTKIERFGGNALRFRYAGNAAIFDDLGNNGFHIRNGGDIEVFRVVPNASVGSSTTDIVNGALRMGSTTIIDVSRNLTNIVGITSSGDAKIGNTVTNPVSGFSDQKGFGYATSTGQVQIATTGNNEALQLGKNNANDGTILTFRKQATTIGSIGVVASNNLFIRGDNVGIGIGDDNLYPTNSSGASTSGALDIGDSSAKFRNLHLSGNISLGDGHLIGDDASDNLVINSSSGESILVGSNQHIFFNTGATSLTSQGTTRMLINSSGNVGIGTSSPAQKLDVVGAIKVSDSILNAGAAGSASVFNEDGTTADFRVESTGNTHMLFVDGGLNKVGIGTSSPSFTLDVEDSNDGHLAEFRGGGTNAGGRAIRIGVGNTSVPELPNYQPYIYSSGSDSASNSLALVSEGGTAATGGIDFYTGTVSSGTAQRMRIDRVGNVGIGTASPSVKLVVAGGLTEGGGVINLENTATAVNGQAWGSLNFISNDSSSGASGTRASIIGTSTSFNGDGNLTFSTAPASGSNTERMRIVSGGNVGINNVSPDEKLHISGGGIKVDGEATIASGSGTGVFLDYASNVGRITSLDQGVAWRSLRLNAADIQFYIAGGQRFRIDASGNFQMGTAATTIIDANRNIRNLASLSMHDNILRLRNNGDNNHFLQYKATGHSGVAIDGAQLQGHQGGELTTNLGGNNYSLRWNNSGDIIVRNTITSGGNITAFSDERLKDNIQTLDGKKALQMRGVSYIRDGKEGSGVIAQEIEKIAPELVLTADDEQGTKSVAYGNLVGYLIEAIKDQQEQIDELKAKLDDCA